MRLRDRMRAYILNRGYPDQKDGYETTLGEKIIGSVTVFGVGAVVTLALLLPLAYATAVVWSESIAVTVWAIPGLVLSMLVAQYIGSPVADAVIGVEYADDVQTVHGDARDDG